MGRIVIAAYHPRDGKQEELLDAIRDHISILRSEGLATDREPTVVRTADGTYLEIFEWASADAIEAAHSTPVVQKLWERFGEACEYRTLASLSEAQDMFAEFEPVDLL